MPLVIRVAMVANDLVNGARLWTQDISGSGSPWIAGDFLYLVTSGSELIALSREDGRIRWVTGLPRYRRPDTREGPITWGGPVLGSDRLIIVSSTGDAVSRFRHIPARCWEVSGCRTQFSCRRCSHRNRCFFVTDDGALVAYR